MRMYHSAFVYGNADKRVENFLMDSDLSPLLVVKRPDNCPPLCYDTNINAYNNMFVDTSGIPKFLDYVQVDDRKQNLRPTFFETGAPTWLGEPVTKTYFRYSSYSYNYWEYDPARNLYLRDSGFNTS